MSRLPLRRNSSGDERDPLAALRPDPALDRLCTGWTPLLPQLHLADRLRAGLRTLRPQAGAVANARDAVHAARTAAGERREAAVLQAAAHGPATWMPFSTGTPRAAEHAVHFHDSDVELLGRLTSYVADGLARGETCVVIATDAHRRALRQRLALAGLDDSETGRLVDLDAEAVLAGLLRDGRPDPDAFELALGRLVGDLHQRSAPTRAFGEMVGLLTARGEIDAALELEELWNGLQSRFGFPLLCAYPVGSVDAGRRQQVCDTHTHAAAS